jgi:hypothetical protein
VETLVLKARGLITSPNTLKGVPGAMVQADNIAIDDEDVVSMRRGFSLERPLSDPSFRGRRRTFFQNEELAAYDGGSIARYTGGTWSNYTGTFNNPDDDLARLRFLEASSNLYALTATGAKVLSSASGTWRSAGAPRALDASGSLTGAASWFTDQNQIAYRHIWVYKDANGNIVRGAPSGRLVLTNNSGVATNVSYTATIPSTITTSWYLQVYRSSLSGGVAVTPSDELFLCYEAHPTAGEITAGTLTFTDSQASSLLGQTLYTSPSREGLLQANYEPPLSWDACLFKNCVFYANVTGKHQLTITLLGTGGSSLVANDTITLGGVTYTAKAAETIASGFFKVFTGGTAAQDIADTAQSLVKVINQYASSTLYATYQSGVSDAPGKILLFERSLGGSTFYAVSSRGGAFTPTLPTSGTTVFSSNDHFQDAVMISKAGEGEAVPAGNIRRVGSANSRTFRVVALRDAVLVFKEDGVFRITGTDPSNFQVDPHDDAVLLAPDSISVLNNSAWGLFDQGICAASEASVVKKSTPIDGKILGLDPTSDEVRFKSFGVSYKSENKYLFWTIEASTDAECTQAFVFNGKTSTVARWPISATCGLVSPVDDKLYLFDGDTFYARIERKDRVYTDYYDAAYATTVTSASGLDVYLGSTEFAAVGDRLWVSDSVQARITAVEPAFVTVDAEITWTLGACEIRKAIDAEWEYAPITNANPAMLANYPELLIFNRVLAFDEMQVSFATDRSAYFEDTTITGGGAGAWGFPAWGDGPWGGDSVNKPKRKLVPKNKQRASQMRLKFRIREAYASFELEGFAFPAGDTGSTRVA